MELLEMGNDPYDALHNEPIIVDDIVYEDLFNWFKASTNLDARSKRIVSTCKRTMALMREYKQFVVIPVYLYSCRNLDNDERLILGVVLSYANDDIKLYMS